MTHFNRFEWWIVISAELVRAVFQLAIHTTRRAIAQVEFLFRPTA